jgi:inhibitor of KinA
VIEWVPANASVTVHYDPIRVGRKGDHPPVDRVREWLERCGAAPRPDRPAAGRAVVIPVCYGGAFGPDLDLVAAACGLSPAEVIARHSGAGYFVSAVGFTPGFPYLGGLPEALHTPRRKTPRVRVPPGSVGIGGVQTGIYPFETPGGWNLIGRTPLRLFNPLARPPAFLQAGDRVRLLEITPEEFGALAGRPEPVAGLSGGTAVAQPSRRPVAKRSARRS